MSAQPQGGGTALTRLTAAPLSYWRALPGNIRGAILVSGGAFLMTVMAVLIKFLAEFLPVFEIVFVRFLAGFLVLLPVIWRAGFRILRTHKLPLHFSRGLTGYCGNLAFFFAVANIALGDAVSIQFSRPLILVVLAALFLGEVVTRQRGLATIVGFGGILMIARPFGEGVDVWTLVALSGAIFSSLVALQIKFLTRTEQTLTIMFYFMAFTTLLSAIPAIIFWQTPTPWQLLLLLITGTFGVVGQSMFTAGLGAGDASFVMPFDYLRIVFAFLFGVLWFTEVPVFWSVAGAAVIVLSSIYLLRSQKR